MLRPWVAVEVSRHLAVLEAAAKPTIALHIRGGDKVVEDRQDDVRRAPCAVADQACVPPDALCHAETLRGTVHGVAFHMVHHMPGKGLSSSVFLW